jgi:hypothetical protein
MHYYSWSFVCVAFHVVTWLPSSIVRIISFMPMFRVLWSQLAMLYNGLIKIVLAACHLKKYFCYHLLLEDEQELSLGMLIRCKHIYNFWCSMLVLLHAPCNALQSLSPSYSAFVEGYVMVRNNDNFHQCLRQLKSLKVERPAEMIIKPKGIYDTQCYKCFINTYAVLKV